jgi:hypothetical protein
MLAVQSHVRLVMGAMGGSDKAEKFRNSSEGLVLQRQT